MLVVAGKGGGGGLDKWLWIVAEVVGGASLWLIQVSIEGGDKIFASG